MSTPVRASISSSLSRKSSPSRRASCRPTALLPEPIGPTRKTFMRHAPAQTKSGRRGAAAAHSRTRAAGASVDLRTLAQDLRRDEDQQLVLVVGAALVAEEDAEAGDVTQVWHLVDGVAALGLKDAAEHDRLSVVDEDLRRDFAGVDA